MKLLTGASHLLISMLICVARGLPPSPPASLTYMADWGSAVTDAPAFVCQMGAGRGSAAA